VPEFRRRPYELNSYLGHAAVLMASLYDSPFQLFQSLEFTTTNICPAKTVAASMTTAP